MPSARRVDPLPLFTELPRETVRKVSEALPAEPNGSPRSGFSVPFALRIAAKSSLGLLLVPFSDSLRRFVLGNRNSSVGSSRLLRAYEGIKRKEDREHNPGPPEKLGHRAKQGHCDPL